MKKINKDTLLSEILEYPGAEKILSKYKLPCLTCPFAKIELNSLKIGEVCSQYGIDGDKLIEELNKKVAVCKK